MVCLTTGDFAERRFRSFDSPQHGKLLDWARGCLAGRTAVTDNGATWHQLGVATWHQLEEPACAGTPHWRLAAYLKDGAGRQCAKH
jgi:hypothetical protein